MVDARLKTTALFAVLLAACSPGTDATDAGGSDASVDGNATSDGASSGDGSTSGDSAPSSDASDASDASNSGWKTVVDDTFNTGGLPTHWESYDGPYGSGYKNCAAPSQATVSGGYLHMLESYLPSGNCGAGWYTAGLSLSGFSSADVQITTTWKVVNNGVTSHHIIPMRWPDNDSLWTETEEDWCETSTLTDCTSFLHYGNVGTDQISRSYTFDQTQWHTTRYTRVGYDVKTYLDGVLVWSSTGNSANTTTGVLKHVVLQQEQASSPSNTSATEEILIDRITVEVPGP